MCAGVGVHSGSHVRMVLSPAPVDTGIVFVRTDVRGVDNAIRAHADSVTETRNATTISNKAGVEIAKDEMLIVRLDLANRDPEMFADPDTFSLTRPAKPTHLSFGAGIHFCLGAVLARLEAEVALNFLLPRIAPEEHGDRITWRTTFSVRGPETFPLQLTGR